MEGSEMDDIIRESLEDESREFGAGETIFKDTDVLNPQKEYVPDQLPERTSEMNFLHSALEPATEGSTPINVFIYGYSGQGKSAAIKVKTRELLDYADQNDLDLEVVHLECEGMEKSYHVLTHLIRNLRGQGAELPKGYHRKELWTMLVEELENRRGTIIIVLDEIANIKDDYILYELPRLTLPDTRLSIIGITNDLQYADSLESKVRSSLGEDEIEFHPYQTDQLKHILARRAAKGLKDTEFKDMEAAEADARPIVGPSPAETIDEMALVSGILEKEVLPLCAAMVANESGDAREALKLFFRACRHANDDRRESVTEEDVRWADEYLATKAVERSLQRLPGQAHLALVVFLKEAVTKGIPVETVDIYGDYEKLCEAYGFDPLSRRRFRQRLNDLVNVNILTKRSNKGRGHARGVANEWFLSADIEVVLNAIPNTNDEDQRFWEEGEMLKDMYEVRKKDGKLPESL